MGNPGAMGLGQERGPAKRHVPIELYFYAAIPIWHISIQFDSLDVNVSKSHGWNNHFILEILYQNNNNGIGATFAVRPVTIE